MSEPQTLGQMLMEEDAKHMAETRAELAAEKAAWDALTPEERETIIAAREAKWDALMGDDTDPFDDEEECSDCGERDDECECD